MEGLCKLHIGKNDIMNGLEGLQIKMIMNMYEGLLRRVCREGSHMKGSIKL